MSSHFAKTNAPAANAGGNQNRRTPLSLTGAGKATGSKNATSSTVAVNQATDKNDKSNTAANVADAVTAISKDVEMKKSSSKNINDVINVNKDPGTKKFQLKQDEISSSTSSQENGYTNGHKRNDQKDDDKKMNTSETTNTEKKDLIPLRESQRKKDKQQQQQKVEKDTPRKAENTMSNEKIGGGKTNEKKKDKISEEGENKKKNSLEKGSDKKYISAEGDALKKEESKIINVIEIQDEKKTKELQEPSPKELEKHDNLKQETISVTEREQLQDVKDQNESLKMQIKCSAINEKYEMEPLIFENEGEIPGHPGASSTPGKILKHREGPLSGEERSKSDTLITDSAASAINSEKTATTSDCSSYSYTYSRPGRICGRKSFRPLPEISFENRYRGYYRPIPDDDRFSSSMNVTVGSEIRNESTNSSFSFFSRGKKRERTPPPQLSQSEFNQIMEDSELSPKSPKRARLDFSGLFGSVASPITKLLSKFSRTKIHTCSTPNVELNKKQNNNPDVSSINDEDKKTAGNDDEVEDVLNVSSVIADDVTAVLDDGNDENIMEGDDVVSIAVEGGDIKDNTVNLKLTEDNDYDEDDNIIIKEKPITTASNESANKRKICNVM